MIGLLRWVRQHSGLVMELLGYGFWLLVDAFLALVSTGDPSSLFPAVVVPGLVLLRRRPGTQLVPVAVGALGVSLACTVVSAPAQLLSSAAATGDSVLSFTEQLALAVLLIALLRRCALPIALVLSAVGALAIVGAAYARHYASAADFTFLSTLGWGGAVAIGLVLREVDTRRRAALEDVRSAERMELARELHDVVAHHVTGIVVAAQAAAVVARRSPEEVDRALATIETAGTDALAAMRRMVGVLRGQDSDGARTPGAELAQVRTLVERFDPEEQLVRFSTVPGLEHAVLPAGVAATGYRVVQEALTNVRRHAPDATAVEVDLRLREEALQVVVRNDGVRALPSTPRGGTGGFGLAGMAERVTALDGALTAGPTAPGVWTVAVTLPLRGAR